MVTTRLLIADDSAAIRRAVAHVVRDCCPGVEIVGEARDYTELFHLLGDGPADVVLIDVNMPCEMDADHVRRKINSHCLLVMSAWFDDATKVRAREFGAVELLDKLNLAGTLGPAIERCMKRSKAAGR